MTFSQPNVTDAPTYAPTSASGAAAPDLANYCITPPLAERHRKMLEDESAITPEVILARGYETVEDGLDGTNRLFKLGFSSRQWQLPGLLIPIHSPDGSNGLYRYRPDNPRVMGKGPKLKSVKYEQPKGHALRLDVNPAELRVMGDPSKPLAFTEGEKKADSLLAHGLPAVSMPGVTAYKGRNALGGIVVNADLDYIALRGRNVYLVFDSDSASNPAVSNAEAMWAEHLRRKGALIHILRLPPGTNGAKCGADDYLAAGHSLTDLFKLEVDAGPVVDPSFAKTKSDGLPAIQTNARHLRDVGGDAYKALQDANAIPYLFRRGGALARVVADEKGNPSIQTVTADALAGRLTHCANFFTAREFNGAAVATTVHPPVDVVKYLLSADNLQFPALTGIVQSPVLRPDGSILSHRGYDHLTGLYCLPGEGLDVLQVPDAPTPAEVGAALALLREAIGEFPFCDDASAANALAALLTPIVRPAIGGNVPFALFDAPQAGTGKSLLAGTISQITTGRDAASLTAPRDGDEWRKRITASLMSGAPIITVDNLTGKLDAAELASVLTTPVWVDRILGLSSMCAIPHRAVWFGTGNNISLGGDMPRRCYQIRLDAKSSRPWTREGFTHEDLPGWVRDNRGRLLQAALTLARNWFALGRPAARVRPIGSFVEWSRTIGGILAAAGVVGFLDNVQQTWEQTDGDDPQWETFLIMLHEIFGGAEFSTADVCDMFLINQELLDALPDVETKTEPFSDSGKISVNFKRIFGRQMQMRKDKRFGDSQIRLEGAARKTHRTSGKYRILCNSAECKTCQNPVNTVRQTSNGSGQVGQVGQVFPSNARETLKNDFFKKTIFNSVVGLGRNNLPALPDLPQDGLDIRSGVI